MSAETVVPRTNAEVVASYLDAVLHRDASAIDRFFHPEVEYIVNGARDADGRLPPISRELGEALPWLGLHRGLSEVHAFFDCMHRNLDVTAYGPREVISEGARAAAFGWFRLHARPTGRIIAIPYSIFFELKNGLIIKYHFLESTFDVASAFRRGGDWRIEREGKIHAIPELKS
jgi:ketosteroid isomerase-like protein